MRLIAKLRAVALGFTVAATLGIAATPSANAASEVHLLETGSSLLYPLFNLWVQDYSKMHPNVRITTQSTGSGTGLAQAISGVAQMGASDAYMSNAMMNRHSGMLNIPVAISSQMVNYNIPGLNKGHLKLSGPVLAAIYAGKIRKWNNAAISKMNPGVHLPDKNIVPVHRSDGSGDTFIFTQYLSDSTPWWGKQLGYGTTVNWPAVPGGLGATGNPGMVNAVKATPYSVAYIGISYKKQTAEAGVGEARLKNRSGNFVLPNVGTVKAAAAGMVPKTPKDERISLIFAPGVQAYPIINYEYVVIQKDQPDKDVAKALKEFMLWAIDPTGGNAEHYMKEVSFVPLPESVSKLSRAQIEQIK